MGGSLLAGVALLLSGAGGAKDLPKTRSVDEVLSSYIQAVGGQAALDKIKTREVKAQRRHGAKLTYYWQDPDKVLLIEGKERIGYDGGSGWLLSKKQRVTKLSKGLHLPLEIDANPLRYANLKKLYPDIQASSPEMLNEKRTDVLVSPNDLGATKLYFDSGSHLLVRVEEKGEVSAYYNHVTEFDDYQEVDGVKLPFRIVHSSTEPGAKAQDIRISEVLQNIPIRPDIFAKPSGSSVVLGGKR